MLNKNQFNRLLHDINRVAKALNLIKNENNKEKRNLIIDLLSSEVDRMYEDLEDARDKNENGE